MLSARPNRLYIDVAEAERAAGKLVIALHEGSLPNRQLDAYRGVVATLRCLLLFDIKNASEFILLLDKTLEEADGL